MKNQMKKSVKYLLGLGLAIALTIVVGIPSVQAQAEATSTADEKTLPSKYSSVEQGYVSPVKDQGNKNICWTYAAMAVYESMLMKNGIPFTRPYSEIELANWAVPNGTGTYFVREKDKGSVAEAAISYLISWSGPNNGEELVHQELPTYAVTDILYVDEKDRNSIKQNIYDYGAVTGSISYEERFLGAGETNYFCKEEQTDMFMHAITVVGWDDNYSKSNFNSTYGAPENDGAWLVKNSYGNWVNSIGGYLWISYEDFYLFKSAQGKMGNLYYTPTKFIKTDETTGMYQIEDFGPTDQPKFSTDSTVTFMNIMNFDNEDDYIDKIVFESYMKGNRYELYYIPLESNGIPTKEESRWTKLGQGEITHNGIMSSDVTDFKLPKGKAAVGVKVFKKDNLENEDIRFGVIDSIASGSLFVHAYIEDTSYVYKNNTLTEMQDYVTNCSETANLFIKVISKNPTAEKVTYELGDINRDKVVDMKDVVQLYDLANGIGTASEEIIALGDLDGNKSLTKEDVQLLQNKVAGLKQKLTYQEKTAADKMYINNQEVQVGSVITYTATIKQATSIPTGMAGYTYYDNHILNLLSNTHNTATLQQQFPILAKDQFAVNTEANEEIIGDSKFKIIAYNAADIFYDYMDFKNENVLVKFEFEVTNYVPGRHTIASGINQYITTFDFAFDGTIGETVVVDNSELADYTAVHDAIAKIPLDLAKYTDASVANLQSVLDSILYNKRKEEQKVVDGYVPLIQTAISQLVEKPINPGPDPVDKTSLQNLITMANTKVETEYTSESWAVFDEALTKAKQIQEIENATQAQVDSAKENLQTAMEQLKKKEVNPNPVDKTSLQNLITTANTKVETEYTSESWAVFDEALTKAKQIQETENATQAQVDSAKKQLLEGIAQLKEKVLEGIVTVNGKQYLYINGVKATGWVPYKGKKYYCGIDGEITVGWKLLGKTWYYFNTNGNMVIGWKQVGKTWYYFNTNGSMVTGWKQVGKKWYYFNTSGSMVTGWKQVGKTWYYFNTNGSMVTGWKQVGKKWYYFNASGSMATGWKQVGKTWYYFNTSGSMATGWKQVGKTWYYFNASGSMATGWKQVGKSWYYLNSNGSMVKGWKYIKHNWYYFSGTGKMLTGWQKYNRKQYYLYPNGSMATNKWIGRYYVDENGIRVNDNN